MQLFAPFFSGALCDNIIRGSLPCLPCLLRQRRSHADNAGVAHNPKQKHKHKANTDNHNNHNSDTSQAEKHARARKGEPILGGNRLLYHNPIVAFFCLLWSLTILM